MHLTKHTDLALRVLMYLGIKQDELVTINEISERYDESKNHLVKVVHKLAGHDYINSIQGRGGGVKLGMSPDDIIIGNVVRDMETSLDIIDCEAATCPLLPACHLKPILDEARDTFLYTLDQYSLADLVANKRKLFALIS